MMQMLLIGIGAGAAAALLFASVASGSLISIVLFYLAPLPILIAAMGWSHWAALIAAIGAAVGLAGVFGFFFFFTFLAGVGLPAWWLGYLALLARPTGLPAPADAEWYPPGRLVMWAAILGALIVVAAIPNFGGDADSFRSGLRATFERILRAQMQTPADSPVEMSGVNTARLIDFLVMTVPPAAAVLATITNTFNLWLAAPRRRRLRPAAAAVARPRGDRVSAFRADIARRRGRGILSSQYRRHRLRHFFREPLDGLCHPRFRRAACDHARQGRTRPHADHRLCRRLSFRLADAAADAARPRRYRLRPARPPRAQARPARAANRINRLLRNRTYYEGVTAMEVILLERVAKLGQMGETVRVKDGFARNFLLPKGKALRATKENKARFESMKGDLEARNLEFRGEAEKVGAKLDGQNFVVLRQASETGQLYGSVSARDLAVLITDGGFAVNRNQIDLNAPIKSIGKHKVPVALHPEVTVSVTLSVARNADEAERLARGEDIMRRAEGAEAEAAEAKAAAEKFFEPEAIAARTEDEETAGGEEKNEKD